MNYSRYIHSRRGLVDLAMSQIGQFNLLFGKSSSKLCSLGSREGRSDEKSVINLRAADGMKLMKHSSRLFPTFPSFATKCSRESVFNLEKVRCWTEIIIAQQIAAY